MADDEKNPAPETPPANPPADPPPANPPVAPAPPAPPTPPAEGDDLRDIVRGLTETVAGLVTSVAALTDATRRDVAPTKVPWTHKGSRPQQ